ncbi:MAG: LPS export ABC transporter permease LptF [Desulfobacterales bacterium]|nr:LPS export ABC transporter permease LptF [Desulfobacterales bacterium]
MPFNSIINRYVFREMIPPFVINLSFFTFVFLMTKILDITHLVVNYRIDLWTVIRMLIYSMPFFLEFIIPMSVMMAVLLAFLRLSSDNEINALKAGGVSIYGLLPPVLLFSLMGFVLTGLVAVYGLPLGRLAFKELVFKVASSNIDIGLKERTFNDSFKDVMLYVNKIDLRSKGLIDVFIEDRRTENIVITVVAPQGTLFREPEGMIFHLGLSNGMINQVDLENKSVNSIRFDTYDIRLDLKKALPVAGGGPKDEEEMSLSELRRFIKDAGIKNDKYYLALMEYHKKFSIPFACFVLGVLALPLGIQSKSAKRSFGIGLGLVFFLLYYILLSAGWVFGEAGIYPPVLGMWVPNIVMGGLGVFLLIRTARERPVAAGAFLGAVKDRFFRPVKKNDTL